MVGHLLAGLKNLAVSASSKRRMNRWIGPVEVLENRIVLSPTIDTVSDDPGISISGSASGIEESNIQVEFDFDQDGMTDSTTNTNSLGWFVHGYPATVSAGDTVSVRAVENGDFGDWVAYTLSSQNSSSVQIGATTIAGGLLEVEIEVAGDPQDVEVSFDVHHDGVVESVVHPQSIPSVVFELPEISGSFIVFVKATFEGETASRSIEVIGAEIPGGTGGATDGSSSVGINNPVLISESADGNGSGTTGSTQGAGNPVSGDVAGTGSGMYVYQLTESDTGESFANQAVFGVDFGGQLGANAALEVDLNGDGVADETIDVSGLESIVFDATASASVDAVTVSFRLVLADPITGQTSLSDWISVSIPFLG
ncbi:MAG: hypothetical protein O3A00_00485 [Planctomycetota bacterium]|nr:hypothetical protein [Planctomycetota bacterium]